ncbi:MAG: hypothetical protein ACUVRS_12755 [Armatimonadota bacterium]
MPKVSIRCKRALSGNRIVEDMTYYKEHLLPGSQQRKSRREQLLTQQGGAQSETNTIATSILHTGTRASGVALASKIIVQGMMRSPVAASRVTIEKLGTSQVFIKANTIKATTNLPDVQVSLAP